MIDPTDVVITGLGLVSPLGATLHAARLALADAAPDIAGGEVPDFDPRAWFRVAKALKLTDRQTRLAVAASAQALSDAGWPDGDAARTELGVVVGTSGSDLQAADLGAALGGLTPDEIEDITRFGPAVLDGVSPLWLLVNLPNMASAHVAIQSGARGPNSTVMTGWASGAQAIAEGAEWVRLGEAVAVVAGGADTGRHSFARAGLAQSRLLREGGAAEAGAMVMLESRESAGQRGARSYGWVAGSASAAGEPEGLAATVARALGAACEAAGWHRDEVEEVISASAPAVFAEPECAALRLTFGARLPQRRSWTERTGHALGASGAVATVLALISEANAWQKALVVSADPSGAVAVLALARPAPADRHNGRVDAV